MSEINSIDSVIWQRPESSGNHKIWLLCITRHCSLTGVGPPHKLIAMSAPWRRACSACTKSKRQCTKQTPSCRRCTDRGIECEYPPNRRPAAPLEPPTLDIRAPAAPIPEASNNVDYAVSLLAGDIDFDYGLLDFGPPIPSLPDPCAGDTHSQDIPPVPSTPSGPESPAPWFLLPSSWEYEHSLPRCQDDISASSLQAYVDTIRSWFFAWVSGASAPSSPLIHAELYRHDMPRCVQDAYTAVATYRHRTPGSSGTALRILEARARQLAQEQALREGLGELGLPEHLARVHALLAYQALRLFDGDVRARAQADEAADTLFAWCEAMWRCAGRARGRQHRPRASRRGGCPSPPSSSSFSARDADGSGSSSSSNASVPRGADLWHTFIRLESVRRAFITANILQHGE